MIGVYMCKKQICNVCRIYTYLIVAPKCTRVLIIRRDEINACSIEVDVDINGKDER